MKLSVEEHEILKGKKGWTWQKILKTIVLLEKLLMPRS
jgi:hypothetical protein